MELMHRHLLAAAVPDLMQARLAHSVHVWCRRLHQDILAEGCRAAAGADARL